MVDQRAHRLGGVALAPIFGPKPVADLGRWAFTQIEGATADDGAISQSDEKGFGIGLGVRADDPVFGIRDTVRMRDACSIVGDTAIVGERGNRFSVLEARRTQNKPLRLEDDDTALGKGRRRESVQAAHSGAPFKSTEGEPATRLPLGLGTLKSCPSIRRGYGCRRILKSTVLLGRSFRHREYGNVSAAFTFDVERNVTVNFREQGVIFAEADISAGVPLGAPL